MNFRSRYLKALRQFKPRNLRSLGLVSIIQVILSIFDLVAIIFVGLIVSISIYGIQSKTYPASSSNVLEFFQLDELNFQTQIAYLGIITASLLIFKTTSSAYLNRKSLFYIAKRGSEISSDFYNNLSRCYINQIGQFKSQEIIYAASSGVDNLTTKLLGTSMTLISDFFLLLVIIFGLLIYDTKMALMILIIFIFIGFTVSKFTKNQAFKLGLKESDLGININQGLKEFIDIYREVHVRNLKLDYVSNLSTERDKLAITNAKKIFLSILNKYVFEISVVLICLLFTAFQFVLYNASDAFAGLGVIVAAIFRVAPAISRIQQGLIQIRGSLGAVESTLQIIDYYSVNNLNLAEDQVVQPISKEFLPQVSIKNLEFQYSNGSQFKVNISDLIIAPGKQVAIVGPSGSGKSTLLDLMIGVLAPLNGDISISSVNPRAAIEFWPGCISYLPQKSHLINRDVIANISLKTNYSKQDVARVLELLRQVELEYVVDDLPNGVHTILNQNGLNLSGGQVQRIGIARALFTKPQLIFLDEPSSALDSQSEAAISALLNSTKGRVTTVIVAHRLSSIVNSDLIIYMEKGEIVGKGNFEALKNMIPNFEIQANLLGL